MSLYLPVYFSIVFFERLYVRFLFAPSVTRSPLLSIRYTVFWTSLGYTSDIPACISAIFEAPLCLRYSAINASNFVGLYGSETGGRTHSGLGNQFRIERVCTYFPGASDNENLLPKSEPSQYLSVPLQLS